MSFVGPLPNCGPTTLGPPARTHATTRPHRILQRTRIYLQKIPDKTHLPLPKIQDKTLFLKIVDQQAPKRLHHARKKNGPTDRSTATTTTTTTRSKAMMTSPKRREKKTTTPQRKDAFFLPPFIPVFQSINVSIYPDFFIDISRYL
ncbi:hypothetical protein pqer_cds_15 [Pandoravirus quercus]|uniref:Uncharacterized protein n=1 Tax=Pandoravirus quercus TaxID=2107709 RepID=A0A2U7U7N7_9VIRU|nr:hypothetical protein pqer_cds_15 [Pandoravirus quercus]AVK74437.1 hypothetical protein pqer_cds_15 [Pandoravirus quercus]